MANRFPDLPIEIDPPVDESGLWVLDVRREGDASPVVVEWRSDRGFGVSTPGPDDYGAGPDEVFTNAKSALERVVRLVLSNRRSIPPESVRLAELRQLLRMSQTDVAKRAGLGQASIARIERRNDVLLTTLTKITAAMGGTLNITAVFPGGVVRKLKVGQSGADEPSA